MKVVQNFHYKGTEEPFVVPTGVTSIFWECWGAAGGMASSTHWAGKVGVLVGGSAPSNLYFTNNPNYENHLGYSYSNNAGYTAGTLTVTPGETFYVNVGGNGKPGYSAIKTNKNGTHSASLRGGAGGFNGGGKGGTGAMVFRNYFNSSSTKVDFTSTSLPSSAALGQLWADTTNHVVRKCTNAYASGGSLSNWTIKSDDHTAAVGPSGGGGGGATDVRRGNNNTTSRIMVAGGSGGSGGPWNKTVGAPSAWTLVACPTTPNPPFGTDTTGTGATDKTNHVWATAINYLTSGWGRGGLGGSASPTPTLAPTSGGSQSTVAGAGAPGTGRHATNGAATHAVASGGAPGNALTGGKKGAGGTSSSDGSSAQGGDGATATGGFDDWCAGGGGGGGGWYGGGGGGQGFLNYGTAASSGATSHGAGGGGGSNYVDQAFGATGYALIGGARPPYPAAGYTAANGLGGFARATFRIPPSVRWVNLASAQLGAAAYNATFKFTPAKVNGKPIAYYTVGTGSTTDTFPTSGVTTINVTDSTLTSFTRSFTAPASGSSAAIFVQVYDTDGDGSGWLKQIITGVPTAQGTPVTITTPASGATFAGTVNPVWTIGGQTPLVAFSAGLTGTDLNTGAVQNLDQSGLRRGGSRVNLATDPGFAATTNVVWSSTTNANLVGNDASFPGVSGKNGKISWSVSSDQVSEQHTTKFNNLIIGIPYRLHLGIASALASDTRQFHVLVSDDTGPLESSIISTSGVAGTYTVFDLVFTPKGQGVYITIYPQSGLSGQFGDTDSGQITYLKDFLIEPMFENDTTAFPAYFDGAHLNGLTGTVSWNGTANASASILTGTDITTFSSVAYSGPPMGNGSLYVTTYTVTAIINGFAGATATQSVKINPSTPTTPTVTLNIDSANGLMHLSINAADGAASNKTVSFDIFRNNVRIVTGLLPDPTTRIALYDDAPGHAVACTYSVRAWDSNGGYVDQTTGTVTGS